MKRFHSILIATLMTLASQASMSQSGNALYGSHTPIVTQPKTVTRNVPVLVKRIAKPKLFRSNPYRLSHFALIDDQDDIFIADDDLATGYRRRDLGKIEQQEEAPLPEHIRWRLFLARQLAMLKYREIHS